MSYLTKVSFNYITYKPVVYAVEDTYQIVFSSNSNSLGWIKVGDKVCVGTTGGGKSKKTSGMRPPRI